mmetsp:Transcript_19094/g.27570  ORF Transcript_19094/g.27570 Transcript_19094/m.27570 type:complete len:314 (+) Transcript_19094:365-1306(+)
MNLKEQLPAHLSQQFTSVQLQHRQRHHICSTTLHGGVDGGPLGVAPQRLVAGVDVGQLAVAPHQRPRVPRLPRLQDRVLLPPPHLRAIVIPRGQHGLGLWHTDPPVLGEPKWGLPVGYGEVQGLGLPPLGPKNVLQQGGRRLPLGAIPLQQNLPAVHCTPHVVKHAHCRPRVEAAACFEGVDHALAPRHVRQQPQLQLPVVRHHQGVALLRHEGLPDLVLVLFEGGLVLQVGSAGAEAPGLCVEVEAAVHAPHLVGQALQGQQEGAQHGLDAAHLGQSLQRPARRFRCFLALALEEVVVGQPPLGRVVAGAAR